MFQDKIHFLDWIEVFPLNPNTIQVVTSQDLLTKSMKPIPGSLEEQFTSVFSKEPRFLIMVSVTECPIFQVSCCFSKPLQSPSLFPSFLLLFFSFFLLLVFSFFSFSHQLNNNTHNEYIRSLAFTKSRACVK